MIVQISMQVPNADRKVLQSFTKYTMAARINTTIKIISSITNAIILSFPILSTANNHFLHTKLPSTLTVLKSTSAYICESLVLKEAAVSNGGVKAPLGTKICFVTQSVKMR